MKCVNCGREIDGEGDFCEFCGTRITEHKKVFVFSRRLGIIAAIVVGIPLLVILFYYCYMDNPRCHRIDYTETSAYYEKFTNETYFYLSPISCEHAPYHFNYKWFQVFISTEKEELFRLKSNNYEWGTTLITARLDFTHWKEDKKAEPTLRIPNCWLPRFEPGKTYWFLITGEHLGLLFNRPAKDICFSITISPNPIVQ